MNGLIYFAPFSLLNKCKCHCKSSTSTSVSGAEGEGPMRASVSSVPMVAPSSPAYSSTSAVCSAKSSRTSVTVSALEPSASAVTYRRERIRLSDIKRCSLCLNDSRGSVPVLYIQSINPETHSYFIFVLLRYGNTRVVTIGPHSEFDRVNPMKTFS